MIKKIIPFAACLFIFGVGYILTFSACDILKIREKEHEEAEASEAGERELLEYEWQRLHDPATGKIPGHIRNLELAFAAQLPNDAKNALLMGKTTASSLSWAARGPWNVGGRTRALAIDASNQNILIAGSCSGGMWRSTDGGSTWRNTSPDTLTPLSVSCLTQDTRRGHTATWYYGTGEAYGASAGASGAYYLGNGIYKSTDSGKTWTVLASTTSTNLVGFDTWGDLIWNIVTNPADTVNDVVIVAAYGGIYRSTNGGTSWTLIRGSLSGATSYFTDVAVSPTGIVYATLSSDGSQRGIFRSVDGGATFTNITPTGFPTTYNRVKIGISPSNEEQVYFLGNTPGFGTPDTNFVGQVEWNSLWRYTYISGDGSGTGGAWQDRSANLPTTGGAFDKFACQGSYDLVVKVKPNDTNTVFIGGTNLYRSTSGFADATHTTFIGGYQPGASLPVVNLYTDHHPDQHELLFMPSDPNVMINGNDGGIFKTFDNRASTVLWQPLNNGYLTSMFYTCAIDHASTNDIVIGGAQDNGSWYTNNTLLTSPWVTPRGGDGSYCAIADNGRAYYLSIQQGKMMKAKLNASGGVDSYARIDPLGGTRYQFINPYTLDPNNNNIMYLAGGKYLWRNNDLSGIPYIANWDSITTNWVQFPDSVGVAGVTITAVAASKTPANRVYFGTSQQRVYRVNNANVGTPTPVNITSTASSSVFPMANVSCVAVDPNNADNVMVTFSNYGVYSIFYSSDGGTNWQKVAGNLEASATGGGNGPSVRWASIMPVTGGTVYLVGTSTGLYATTALNGLATVWTQMGTNTIGSAVVDMIDYRTTDGLVVVATHSHGMYSTHITHVTDVNSINDPYTNTASAFAIQLYPNPVLNNTTLTFETPTAGTANVAVYAMSGEKVAEYPLSNLPKGKNSVNINTELLAPGYYTVVLKVGSRQNSMKMSKW